MVDLSAIVSHQAAATVDTAAAVYQLLDYITMYPHDGITYRASDMNFSAHSALYTSMNACHAAAWDIKIFSHKKTPRLYLMDQFSPFPQSSNLSCPWQLNMSLARFSLQIRKWFLCAKHSSKWDGLSLPLPSKLITPLMLALSTKTLSLDA